jgi:two-component system, chemotaxis family, protein-glutamate methylesterase/glutaminase
MSRAAVVGNFVIDPESQGERAPIPKRPGRARIIAIASSTGGPQALQEVLAALPANFGVPILVVQHMAKGYVAGLASALATKCRMQVKLAEHREPLRRGTIYLAPDDYHLEVADLYTIELSDAPAVEGFRPSATWLFSTVADQFRAGAIGVVLTGRGRDGIAGLVKLHRAGGLVVAQDKESSVACEMPQAAIEAGVADFVVPLQKIAGQLMALI